MSIITDEMVEAARKAWHETYLAAAPRAKLSPGIPPTLTVYTGGEALRFRAVITAVTPMIRAAALEEAAEARANTAEARVAALEDDIAILRADDARLRHWLSWAVRRIEPGLRRYIPRDLAENKERGDE